MYLKIPSSEASHGYPLNEEMECKPFMAFKIAVHKGTALLFL